MSNFGSLGDIRRKLKDEHSFDKVDDGNEQKKQKVSVVGETPSTAAADGGVDMTRLREQWSSFVKEKKKNKFKEIAIEVCHPCDLSFCNIFTLHTCIHNSHIALSINTHYRVLPFH